MHKGCSSRFVCLSVIMKSATYLVYTLKTRCHRVLTVFQGFCRVALAKSTLFKSFGGICRLPLLSSLPDELLMDGRDSNDFLCTKLVSMPSIN